MNAVSCNSQSDLEMATQVLRAGVMTIVSLRTSTCWNGTHAKLNSEIQQLTTIAVFLLTQDRWRPPSEEEVGLVVDILARPFSRWTFILSWHDTQGIMSFHNDHDHITPKHDWANLVLDFILRIIKILKRFIILEKQSNKNKTTD